MVAPVPLIKVLPVFVITTMLLLLLIFVGQGISLQQQVLLTVLAVLILGMPHGALDVLMISKVVNRTQSSLGLSPLITAAVLYLAYAGVTCLAFWSWLQWPMLCLSIFLIISAIHFGNDWRGFASKSYAIAFGVMVVTLPALRFADDISLFFSQLNLSQTQSNAVVQAMQIALVLCSVGIIIAWARTPAKKPLTISLCAIIVTGLILPPLTYFVAYFCGLHSILHTLSVKHDCQVSWGTMVRSLLLPMVGTLVLLSIAYLVTPAQSEMARWLHVVFIGLFALTVPHMLLTYAHDRYISDSDR
jgi:Brp/Blh family beta-carotene 15,15'-monooxygenase